MWFFKIDLGKKYLKNSVSNCAMVWPQAICLKTSQGQSTQESLFILFGHIILANGSDWSDSNTGVLRCINKEILDNRATMTAWALALWTNMTSVFNEQLLKSTKGLNLKLFLNSQLKYNVTGVSDFIYKEFSYSFKCKQMQIRVFKKYCTKYLIPVVIFHVLLNCMNL